MDDLGPRSDPGGDPCFVRSVGEHRIEPGLGGRPTQTAGRLGHPKGRQVVCGCGVAGEERRARGSDGGRPRVQCIGSTDIADEHVARGVVRNDPGAPGQLVAGVAGSGRVVVEPTGFVVVRLVANEPIGISGAGRNVLGLHHQSRQLVGAGCGKHRRAAKSPRDRFRSAELHKRHPDAGAGGGYQLLDRRIKRGRVAGQLSRL